MNNFLEKNLKALKTRDPYIYDEILSSKSKCELQGIAHLECLLSKNSLPILSVTFGNDEKMNLSSSYDPNREGESISASLLQMGNEEIMVIVGSGSGYIIESLVEKNMEKEIVWIEYDKRILEKILSLHDFSEILSQNNIHLILSKNAKEVVKKVAEVRMKRGFKALRLYINPSAKKICANFCKEIEDEIIKMNSSPIRRIIDYKKFKNQNLNIIVFDSSYFTVAECIKAFRILGHNVFPIKFKDQNKFIKKLLNLIFEIKPDFIFTVNHLGFDEDGALTSLLSSMKIPFAVWYVDNPFYALKDDKKNVSDFCKIFMWEKTYINPMKNKGFRNVSYLPLAADTELFKPMPFTEIPKRYVSDISFVGNSMFDAVKKWQKKIKEIEKLKKIEDEIINIQLLNHKKPIEEIMKEKVRNDLSELMSENDTFINAAAYLTWKTTMKYRHSVVKKGIEEGGVVYGDKGWKYVVDDRKIRNSVDYYSELALVYNGTKINLNCTSFQMNSALNQRVFDCAACNSFLITDDQSDLYELFNEDEFVSFKETGEIPDLIRFYIKNEKERQKISLKAFNRVMNEHSYEKRMHTLVEEMKKAFKEQEVYFSKGYEEKNVNLL
ncbi:MAG: hypothetical protein D6734_12415 [Candidatus Schekmanbacteria bacterium]|nr:MAG: hypothetical protein D6734_12415 [Candidatus Schekmanbacteria bacterium]